MPQTAIALPFGPGHRWAAFMRFLERPDINPDAKFLLGVLLAHCNGRTGRNNPSLVRLARLMGRCVNTVKAARRQLVELGILAVVFDGRHRAHYAVTELLPPRVDPSPGDGHPSPDDGSTSLEPSIEPPATPAERLRAAARRDGPHLAYWLDQARLRVEAGRQLHIACNEFGRDRLKTEWDRLRRLAGAIGLEVSPQWVIIGDPGLRQGRWCEGAPRGDGRASVMPGRVTDR